MLSFLLFDHSRLAASLPYGGMNSGSLSRVSIGQGEPVAGGQQDWVPRSEEPPAPWLLPGHRLLPPPQGQGALGGWPPHRMEPFLSLFCLTGFKMVVDHPFCKYLLILPN